MAITQAMCGSFKQELFGGIHDLDTDQLKMALYLSSASLSSTTTAYTTSGETSGTNYTAGGNNISNVVISLSGNTAFIDFDDVVFSNVSLTARGALIYNSSKANRAVAVLDFGEDKTSTTGNFEVQLPTGDASSAIIRIV